MISVVGSLISAVTLWRRQPPTVIRWQGAELCLLVGLSQAARLLFEGNVGFGAGGALLRARGSLPALVAHSCFSCAAMINTAYLGANFHAMMVRLVRSEYLESAKQRRHWRLGGLALGLAFAWADWRWFQASGVGVAMLTAGCAGLVLALNARAGAQACWSVRQTAMRAPRPIRRPNDMKLLRNQIRFSAEVGLAWLCAPFLLEKCLAPWCSSPAAALWLSRVQSSQGVFMLLFFTLFPRE